MKLGNIQLFESMLSPRRQRLHWYRGVNMPELDLYLEDVRDQLYLDDPDMDEVEIEEKQEEELIDWVRQLNEEEVGVNYETTFGDKTPALWFSTSMVLLRRFASGGVLAEVALDTKLDLFNYFNPDDFKRFEQHQKRKRALMPRPQHILDNYLKKPLFMETAYEELEFFAGAIKELGFDGIIMTENALNVELFYNKFSIIKVYTNNEAWDLTRKYQDGKLAGKINYQRRLDIQKKQRAMNTRRYNKEYDEKLKLERGNEA